jgi:hypothetical protein
LRIGDTNSTNVVLAGAGLARKLMEDIEVRAHRWKVLSDFWAEMMLYVAPCDDAKARAHLEALLTHAGAPVCDRRRVHHTLVGAAHTRRCAGAGPSWTSACRVIERFEPPTIVYGGLLS